jgi:CcmD family protein
MMDSWGYVFLAYGIVWGALLLYLFSLKRRFRRAEMEAAELSSAEELQKHAQK